jgi:hypothetical protein
VILLHPAILDNELSQHADQTQGVTPLVEVDRALEPILCFTMSGTATGGAVVAAQAARAAKKAEQMRKLRVAFNAAKGAGGLAGLTVTGIHEAYCALPRSSGTPTATATATAQPTREPEDPSDPVPVPTATPTAEPDREPENYNHKHCTVITSTYTLCHYRVPGEDGYEWVKRGFPAPPS